MKFSLAGFETLFPYDKYKNQPTIVNILSLSLLPTASVLRKYVFGIDSLIANS